MSWLDKINPFHSESEEEKEQKAEEEKVVAEQQKAYDPEKGPECSVCGQPGADKSFGGMKFHKRCLRKTRKQAKGMV